MDRETNLVVHCTESRASDSGQAGNRGNALHDDSTVSKLSMNDCLAQYPSLLPEL